MPVENCNGRVCSTFSKAGISRVETSSYIYVPGGRTAEIKIFHGSHNTQIGSVKLLEDADSIGYDPDTKHVTNGGAGRISSVLPMNLLGAWFFAFKTVADTEERQHAIVTMPGTPNA